MTTARSFLWAWKIASVMLLMSCLTDPAVRSMAGAFRAVPAVNLDVALAAQARSNWCWSASAEMVMQFHAVTKSQCQQATDAFGVNCCDSSNAKSCNKTGWPQFKRYGFDFLKTANTPLSWDQVRAEIDAERPFCFARKWIDDYGGHIVVVKGYRMTPDGERVLIVNDPAPVGLGKRNVQMTYEKYCDDVNGRRPYRHWNDYYQIRL